MSFTAKHSNVYYIFQRIGEQSGFEAAEKARAIKNDYGLDLFLCKGNVYEGRTGCKFITEAEISNLDFKMKSIGGVEGFNELVENLLPKTGESPRYTRPGERKNDIFPPKEKDETIVFAKDSYGKKHYFFRFDYEGIKLFTLKNAKDYFRQVYVQCEGYMLGIDQHHRLEEIKKWLDGLGEGGVKADVEKRFNEQMANPNRWADPGFANILGRGDEAKAHNAPIREAREIAYQRQAADREDERLAAERAAKDEYDKAIKEAEHKLRNRLKVRNCGVLGDKSLIMQLFREHEIAVPLKTQGWIINSLTSVFYRADRDDWSYRYDGKSKPSTVFWGLFDQLLAAIQTKQQFEEMTQSGGDAPDYNSHNDHELDEEHDEEI